MAGQNCAGIGRFWDLLVAESDIWMRYDQRSFSTCLLCLGIHNGGSFQLTVVGIVELAHGFKR